MTCFKPATPGFIVTLVATVLLALVSFCVPWIKSIYFLKATVKGFDGSLTFGTLGYCLQQSSGTTCSKPSVGYQIDINTLLGNNTQITIPSVVVKWITYALVLHIVALVLSGISAVFGLLAHIREMSMTCCSTCASGFAAAVALIAFIFDIALFFLTKSRINSEAGGSATIGNAIWLTLAAWVLLFFSGFFYCCGRCCISDRPRGPKDKKIDRDFEGGHGDYTDQMRMDAIKAEAERKARQTLGGESGLPAFHEYEPLTHKGQADEYYEEGDEVVRAEGNIGQGAGGQFAGGYVQAPPGTRAVDEYYSPTSNSQYPPQPQQQHLGHALSTSSYSTYSNSSTPTPVPQISNGYLATGNQYGHNPSGPNYQPGVSHEQYSSHYSDAPAANYYNQPVQQHPERSYSLGGSGYGDNVVPVLHPDPSNLRVQQASPPPMMRSPHSPPPTAFQAMDFVQSPVEHSYHDNPPVYDDTLTQPPGAWGSKSYAI